MAHIGLARVAGNLHWFVLACQVHVEGHSQTRQAENRPDIKLVDKDRLDSRLVVSIISTPISLDQFACVIMRQAY